MTLRPAQMYLITLGKDATSTLQLAKHHFYGLISIENIIYVSAAET